MGENITCRQLIVTQKKSKGILGGPHTVSFQIESAIPAHINIVQGGIRTTSIVSDSEVPIHELNSIFTIIERLLMLFDGQFIPIQTFRFMDSTTSSEEQLISRGKNYLNNRLPYYNSLDICQMSINKLFNFDSVLTQQLYEKWVEILDELDIVHQMYLYSLCDNKLPIDVKCAFLIELAEPLVEIVKSRKHYFSSLTPGERNTTLKNCLDALITKYGESIFQREMENDYGNFLQAMVNSRVRIMHIKRNQKGIYFDGKESELFIAKMSLLYRVIIFELLGIDQSLYRDSLDNCITQWNKWLGVLDNLLLRLK